MKRRVFNLLLVLVLLMPGYRAYNQKIIYPETLQPWATFQQFRVLGGAGGTAVTSVYIDRKGLIWCGLESGLYRFNGQKYDGFKAGKSDSSIYGPGVLSITEDTEGTIWAGTYFALNRIDLKTWKVRHYFPDTSDLTSDNNSITLIKEDSKGLLWLLTKKDVFSFNRKRGEFTRYPLDSSAWNCHRDAFNYENERFCEDRQGRIWIATNNGLYSYSDSIWKKIWPSPGIDPDTQGNKVTCISEDLRGNIWFGTEKNGLFKLSGNSDTLIGKGSISDSVKTSTGPNITALYFDKTGKLWCFGNNMLAELDEDGFIVKSWTFINPENTIRGWDGDLIINKIFQGEDGSLWLSAIRPGLMFNFIPEIEKLTLNLVPNWIDFTCVQDKSHDLWIGAVYSNLFRLSTDSVPYLIIPSKHNATAAFFDKNRIAEDQEGNLWLVLRTDGICRLRSPYFRPSISLEKIHFPFSDLNPLSVYCQKSNDIWFGCDKNTVVKYSSSDNKFRRMNVPSDYTKGTIEIITDDKKGNLWFVDPNHAIYVLRTGAKQIEKFLSYSDLPGNLPDSNIWDFLVDQNDELWISTLYGIYKTDQGKKKIYDLCGADGEGRKYGDWFIRLFEDDEKIIWALSTLHGPYFFDRERNVFSRIELKNESFGLYYRDMNIDSHGRLWLAQYNSIKIADPTVGILREISFSSLAFDLQSYRTKSGEIVILNANSILIFPEKIPYNKHIPPVYFTNLFINNKRYNSLYPEKEYVTDLNSIDLKFRQNSISLEFAALDFMQPHLNKYRFIMNGLEMDTVETFFPSAEYVKIPNGKYSFWVTGSNNDGLWNPDGVTLDITIHPPFYKSAMAYIIYMLLFASLIVIYIRLRLSRLLKEKIRLEAEVSQRTSELKIKNLQLEEADKIKTRFFTNIAHEIRTPLSLILAPLDKLIGENGDDEKEGSAFELMKRNGQRLMQLVNQLLDISRLDSGKMKIILSETDIIKSIRILDYEFLSIAESKNIRYIVEVPDKELITWADIDKTEKIISNLLSNAFKFTPAGGTVSCCVKLVKGEGSASGNMLEIRTTDSGPGISADHLEKIFDRFYRVEIHHGREGTGTGIGLALVQEFVSLLHGNIKVNSIPGKGSEFIVTIPVGKDHLLKDEYVEAGNDEIDRQKPHLLHDIDKAHRSDEARGRETRITLLVIEDNEDLRNFICESMAEDYNVLESEDGKEGASLALTMIPDLIITDLMMPGMDGISLCSLLKNDERTSHIPVIMLTAKATSEERIEGLRSGADDYITKPFNLTELKVRIANLLDQREKLRIRYRNHFAYSLQNNDSASVDDRFMDKIYSIIRENIRDFSFDAGTLHEKAGMSRVHLFRKLKAITGIPPSILIRNIRLETAARCLLSNTGNITEISNSVGISNPSYFTKCFRKHFGVSPKDYSGSQKEKA